MLGEVGLARGVENMDPFALEMLHELPLQLGHLEAFQKQLVGLVSRHLQEACLR